MKHILLLLSFCFITTLAVGQSSYTSTTARTQNVDLRVYPNPTTEYIKVNNNDIVGQIAVYNLAGRKIKSFNYSDGQKYYLGDLPRGMYLVQLISTNQRRLATRRLSVR